jgi:two-component system response regulator PilR (NtrC family)
MRSDLVFRLRECEVGLPPLRARLEDLGALIADALADIGREATRVSITPTAARRLCCAPYPGNIRQLRAVVRAAAAIAGLRDGAVTVAPEHLSPDLDALAAPVRACGGSSAPPVGPASDAAPPDLERLSQEALRRALRGRTKTAAARSLGVSARHLDRLLNKHGLAEEYRRR